jgi:hypothetical protein
VRTQGNSSKSANTNSNIYILGNSSGRISDGVISNNIIRGGAFGIGLDYTDRIIVDSNSIVGFVTRPYSVTANNTAPNLDRREKSAVTLASASYTVGESDYYIYANYAGTVTLVLPDATKWEGRELLVKTYKGHYVNSSATNVAEYDSVSANTAQICPNGIGWWALLKSNGVAWQKIMRDAH